MSNKPKIYARCPAGCNWEVPHMSDFEKSATYVDVPLNVAQGSCKLEKGKTYKVWDKYEGSAVFTMYITIIRKAGGDVPLEETVCNVTLPSPKDRYTDYVTFKLINVYEPTAGEIGIVYEVNGTRTTYTDTFVWNPAIDDVYGWVINSSKVNLFNEDANILLTESVTELGQEYQSLTTITDILALMYANTLADGLYHCNQYFINYYVDGSSHATILDVEDGVSVYFVDDTIGKTLSLKDTNIFIDVASYTSLTTNEKTAIQNVITKLKYGGNSINYLRSNISLIKTNANNGKTFNNLFKFEETNPNVEYHLWFDDNDYVIEISNTTGNVADWSITRTQR